MVTTGLKLPPICKAHWLGGDNGEWDQTVKPPIRQDNTMRKQFRVGDGTVVAAAVQATFNARTRERYPNATIRYTDGSKTDNDGSRVGFGIYTPNGTTAAEYHRLPAQCSVYSAEAAAIFRAITMDHQQQQQRQQQNDNNTAAEQQQLLIVTDSASCLDALHSTSRNKRQHPYVQAIMKHTDRKRTTLMWVPAHQGIVGNEEADQLAALGRTDGTLYTTEVPGDDVCTWVERIVRRAWVQHWKDQSRDGGNSNNSGSDSNSSKSNNSNNSKSNSSKSNKSQSNSNNRNSSNSNSNNSNSNSSNNSSNSNDSSNSRKTLFLRKLKTDPTETWADRSNWREQRVLSRLRTGYTRFSHNYNHRRNDHDDGDDEQENGNEGNSSNRFESWCTKCNKRNSVEHAICECRHFGQQRKMYGISDNIRMALQSDASSEAALICYLRDTGLYGRT